MDKKKGIMFGILLILFAVLLAFVAVMQYQFMNPSFTETKDQVTVTNENEATNKSDDVIDISESEIEDQDEKDSDEKSLESSRFVIADQLNVRSGPGSDYEITGLVTLNQEVEVEVEVEDDGDEWVKITTEDFTGYVNEQYLAEEKVE